MIRRVPRPALLLAAALLAVPCRAQGDDGAEAVPLAPGAAARVLWPDGEHGRVLGELVRTSSEPARRTATDPWPRELARGDGRWRAHWRAWAGDLAAERDRRASRGGSDADGGERLARLTLCALHQGRDGDAWDLVLELAARDGARALGLAPHLLVGAPLELDPTTPLPEGVVLRPALPPPDAWGRPVREALEVSGLVVGTSTVSARLHVRGDGVDLRYRLDAGPPVRFGAVLPVPPGLEIAVEYFDWERAETRGEPLQVALEVPGEWYRLWGRVRPVRSAWPARAPREVPRALELHGLDLLLDPSDPEAPYLLGFAAACTELFPFEVRTRAPGTPPIGPVPHLVDLSPSERRGDLLRDLLGHLQEFVLGAVEESESHAVPTDADPR